MEWLKQEPLPRATLALHTNEPVQAQIAHALDLDGDLDWSGPGEFQDDSTFNAANELLERGLDTDDTAGYEATYVQTHNKKGDLVDDGRHYKLVYDPFGRLRKVLNRSNDALIAEYRSNGLGFRIASHTDVTDDGTTGDPDGVVDGDDPWFYFAYDERWRVVATFRGDDANPKEVFVHHAAGVDGTGGSSYLDAMILRDRDASTAWHEEADAAREERRYSCHNWRGDVGAILSASGRMVEWVKYSAYGVPFALPAGDTDSDGDFDATDVSAITGGYDVRKDVELDGDVDAFDILAAAAITGGYQTLGRDRLSSSAVNSRRGYAGYEYAPEFAGIDRHLYHVRHRVYDAELGRWTRRDPLGYVDGVSLYEYVRGMPMVHVDPFGTSCFLSCSDCLLQIVPAWRIPSRLYRLFKEFIEAFGIGSDCYQYLQCMFAKRTDCHWLYIKCASHLMPDSILRDVLDKIIAVESCLDCLACMRDLLPGRSDVPFEPVDPNRITSCDDLDHKLRISCRTCPPALRGSCKSETGQLAIECATGVLSPDAAATQACHVLHQLGCRVPTWCIQAGTHRRESRSSGLERLSVCATGGCGVSACR